MPSLFADPRCPHLQPTQRICVWIPADLDCVVDLPGNGDDRICRFRVDPACAETGAVVGAFAGLKRFVGRVRDVGGGAVRVLVRRTGEVEAQTNCFLAVSPIERPRIRTRSESEAPRRTRRKVFRRRPK